MKPTDPTDPTDPTESTESPPLRAEGAATTTLARVVVAGALLTVLGSAACAALAALGAWTPLLAGTVLAVLAAVSVRLSRAVRPSPAPVWACAAMVVIAVAATVWAGATHSERVLPRRDAGSYLQSAIHLAEHHDSPIRVPAGAVGGPQALSTPGVTLESPAFFATGTPARPTVQPQFLIGAPAWYSVGYWVHGVDGALWTAALFGGLGVLAIGVLTGAVVGAGWGPLGALGAALCFPLLEVNRATYSEPLAVFVLVPGLLLLAEATRCGKVRCGEPGEPARSAPAAQTVQAVRGGRLGLLAGTLVGGGGLVRADALRESILLLPIAALLVIRRNPAGSRVVVATVAATIVSAVAGAGLAGRYLASIRGSLVPLIGLGVVLAVLSALLVVLARRGVRLAPNIRRALPALAAAAVVVVGVVLATRPWWQTVRQSAADPGAQMVAALQSAQGLTVDGGRTYAEHTLTWTSWWTGPLALVMTFLVVAVGARRLAAAWAQDRPLPHWYGPMLLAFASAVLTWWRPGITPDHPWADRRLFIILPLVVVASVAAVAGSARWSRRRRPAVVSVAVPVAVGAALLVPTALATAPHAGERVELGELAAVRQVCRAVRPGDLVLMVDDRAVNEWPQVVRGMCGVPALALEASTRHDEDRRAAAVGAVLRGATAHGRRLVLMSAGSAAKLRAAVPAGSAATVQQVVDVTVMEDPRLLERRPEHLVPLPIQVWLARLG